MLDPISDSDIFAKIFYWLALKLGMGIKRPHAKRCVSPSENQALYIPWPLVRCGGHYIHYKLATLTYARANIWCTILHPKFDTPGLTSIHTMTYPSGVLNKQTILNTVLIAACKEYYTFQTSNFI